MAEFNEYLFDNEESDDERASREKKELAAVDSWFGIANSTGIHMLILLHWNILSISGDGFKVVTKMECVREKSVQGKLLNSDNIVMSLIIPQLK